jgi:hypothetical protein
LGVVNEYETGHADYAIYLDRGFRVRL